MGKASKWIRNLLIGKKEEKIKKRDFSIDVISMESLVDSPNSIMPRKTRRWSFARSASTRNHFVNKGFVLRSMKSFDSIIRSEQLAKALVKYSENEHVEVTKLVFPSNDEGLIKHGAATKIQAFFRSYLARRALCALRALVKLQALVRGHLVRKRTTATLRCMHALISIQVRARVQRISLSDESQSFSNDQTVPTELIQHKEAYTTTDENIMSGKRENTKTKSMPGDHTEIKRIDAGLSLGQELYIRTPSSLSNASTRQNTATRTKQNMPARYMADTESSKAKVRSQSAPKQRPEKSVRQKSKRSNSIEQLDFGSERLTRSSSTNMSVDGVKNQNAWLAKLYQSAKGVHQEYEYDSTSITTDSSNYSSSMMTYETPVNLY